MEKTLKVARRAAAIGSEILLQYFGRLTQISEKNLAGLVSEADVESEKAIIEYLKTQFPHIPVLGEESDYQAQKSSLDLGLDQFKNQPHLWLIDPLDGTTNYIHKLPFYCVSIGLIYDNQMVLGVCEMPSLQTVYHAAKGYGAFKNDNPIHVSTRTSLKDSLLATGFASSNISQKQLELFGALSREARGIRRIGSAAYDLCLVAEGVFEGYWEKDLSPWDTAGGAVIVREAGGVVSNFTEDRFSPFDKSIVSGNPLVYNILKQKIHQHLSNL